MSKDFRGQLLRGTQVIFGWLAAVFLLATLWSGYQAFQTGELGVTANVAPFASATATLFLVVVTAYYARSTRQNVDLATKELNQEIREKHTEILRRRVERWLGEEYDTRYERTSLDERNINIPYVSGAEIESAPPIIDVFGRKEEFRVVPEELEDDPYLNDLLENHAPDMRRISREIVELQSEFVELKSKFEETYTEEEAFEPLPQSAELTQYFDEWAFERVILLERGVRDREGLDSIVASAIDEHTSGYGDVTQFPGDNSGRTIIECPREGDYEQEDVVDVLVQCINRLNEHEEAYEIGQQAAELLDTVNEKCRELEMLLVEYRGRLVYPGSCEYIEEASV